ncbi:hypothetical protein JOB18_035332 [Solea senegalensis]|uniref:Uncharacterized protein n=1 Tax=Solea senegalensis TaxID=28829 RepID=A0AAV6R2G2_SOLSE|nr:hypothetical protein JOB18_035332 [Solea senegalensis]
MIPGCVTDTVEPLINPAEGKMRGMQSVENRPESPNEERRRVPAAAARRLAKYEDLMEEPEAACCYEVERAVDGLMEKDGREL